MSAIDKVRSFAESYAGDSEIVREGFTYRDLRELSAEIDRLRAENERLINNRMGQELIVERRAILNKTYPTTEDKRRLSELDEKINALPIVESVEQIEAKALIKKYADNLRAGREGGEMIPIETKEFRHLGKRDFENGAVRCEIYAALKQRDDLLAERETLWVKAFSAGYLYRQHPTMQNLGVTQEARRRWSERGEK